MPCLYIRRPVRLWHCLSSRDLYRSTLNVFPISPIAFGSRLETFDTGAIRINYAWIDAVDAIEFTTRAIPIISICLHRNVPVLTLAVGIETDRGCVRGDDSPV